MICITNHTLKDAASQFYSQFASEYKKTAASSQRSLIFYDQFSFLGYKDLTITPRLLQLFMVYGGDGGSRTHVQNRVCGNFSERSLLWNFRFTPWQEAAEVIRYPVRSPRLPGTRLEFSCMSTPGQEPAGEPQPTRGAAQLSCVCERIVIFSVCI